MSNLCDIQEILYAQHDIKSMYMQTYTLNFDMILQIYCIVIIYSRKIARR